MAIKKVLLLTQIDNPPAESIHSSEEQREIVFTDDMIYAVILASRYEGKGYTTHSSMKTTNKKIRQRDMEHEDWVVIDKDGQKYFKEYQEGGDFILSKVIENAFVDHTVLEDKVFVFSWNRPSYNRNVDMTIDLKDLKAAFRKFRGKCRGVENLKVIDEGVDDNGDNWILYSCGATSNETIHVINTAKIAQQDCVS